MASTGVRTRLRRLQGPGGRFLLAALDHGLPAGPLPGLEDPAGLVGRLADTPVSGVLVNPGIARALAAAPWLPGLVVHLSAGTVLGAQPTSKVLASLPERACALGADAVSVQVHFGDPAEDRMMDDAGRAAEQAAALGLPLLVMAYPGAEDVEAVRHAARASAEIHADVVQTRYTGSGESFREVVRGCPVPVIVAGGPRASSPETFLASVRDAMAAGAAGVAAGRNLFQHEDPTGFARRIGEAVFRSPVGG